MRLPTQRFHPSRDSAHGPEDWDYDDDHGWLPVLQREVTVDVELPNGDVPEYTVDLKRDSVDDPWEATATDAPLEHAKAAMDAAEEKANR